MNYKKYSEKLEKAWRKDRGHLKARIDDYVDTFCDYKDKSERDKTSFFLLGLLIGAWLIETIILAVILT